MQKEQQEKLVEYWLGQHEKMKSELSSLLSMANAAADVESIGVEELQGRFQQYIDFLEEHEQVGSPQERVWVRKSVVGSS